MFSVADDFTKHFTLQCDVQCLWKLVSMWTWHSIVRHSWALRTHLSRPCTPTTVITIQSSIKCLAVQKPDLKQTLGGRSTLEWHCTSGASNSPTEETAVVDYVHVCFIFHTDLVSSTTSFNFRRY